MKTSYADNVYDVPLFRQKIHDEGLENTSVRKADIGLLENLYLLVAGFVANRYSFSTLVPRLIAAKDLKHWWFRIDEIAKGRVQAADLPRHLRRSAEKFQTFPLRRDILKMIIRERRLATPFGGETSRST